MGRKSPEKKLELAEEKIRIISHLIFEIIHLNENNRIVCYSDALSKQIPPSFAGHSFQLFQSTMLNYEILRLCALWDKPKDNSNSIMTVIDNVDDDRVLDLIYGRVREWFVPRDKVEFIGPIKKDDFTKSCPHLKTSRGNLDAIEAADEIASAIKNAREVFASDELHAMRIQRDKRMAHSLSDLTKERTRPVVLKYGFEKEILEKTIPIIETLYLWITGTQFEIGKDSRKVARMYAEDLWHSCSFTVQK